MLRLAKLFLLVLLILSPVLAPAQEGGVGSNCGNGLDDDGDGYVDCYDGECSGASSCDDSVIQPDPSCEASPSASGSLFLTEKWRTVGSATPMDNRQVPVVGDIDGDGFPEIVAKDDDGVNELYVFSGVDGALEVTITSPSSDTFADALAIGDTDGDGLGEIFFVSQNTNADPNDQRKLFCYENDGTQKWRSTAQVGYNGDADRWSPHLADFDQDGQPEVYLGNMIFNSATGDLIVSGGNTDNRGASNSGSRNEPFPVAVDVLADGDCANCSGLELVAGSQVYSVDISTGGAGAGTLTVERDFFSSTFRDGLTSVVDLDQDGDLDAVVTARTAGAGTPATTAIVYAWDLQTTTQIGTTFVIDNATNSPGSSAGSGGHANIADFNGDGTLEIGLAGDSVYVVIDYDEPADSFSELWSLLTDDASDRTGSTVFDFEGDGANEVVYRSESILYVLDGTDGSVITSTPCNSSTRTEYPLVVDVDADGQTDIVCACSNFIIAFEASTDPWIRAREVWNQHGYFVVNVNDDLTIPRTQQMHQLGFPASAPANFPLNAYLTQATQLKSDGTPRFAVADATISIADPSTDIGFSGTCGSGTIDLTLTVTNLGDEILSGSMPISLYNGDPFTLGAASLIATTTLGSNVAAGNSTTTSISISDQSGAAFDLYVIANHLEGNGVGNPPNPDPLTTADYISSIIECDVTNNVYFTSFAAGCNLSLVAADDIFSVDEDNTLNGDLSVDNGNGVDFDPNGDPFDYTTTQISGPTNGTLTINANGTFTYVPDAEYNGLDQFVYEICETPARTVCATATATITVNSINDLPNAMDDDVSTTEEALFNGDVLTNDSNPDGELPVLTTTVTDGTLIWNGDGTYSYMSDVGFTGTDSFTYEVCDDITAACSSATVTITVSPDNDRDRISDLLDADDDNDGIADIIEVCGIAATDFSCLITNTDPADDDDMDGTFNYMDADWAAANSTTINANGAADVLDNDGDGVIDQFDIDSDNDGVIDNIEAQTSGAYISATGTDTDGDGLDDAYDVDCAPCGATNGVIIIPVNHDSNGAVDYLDDDTDGDGALDIFEAHDGDGNNVADWDTNMDQMLDPGEIDMNDTDGDGLWDEFDPDNIACAFSDLGQPTNGGCSALQDSDLNGARDWRDGSFILAIDLIDFEVFYDVHRAAVQLDWQASFDDTEDQGFEVQRSLDAQEFETIEYVPLKGQIEEVAAYQYLDEDAVNLGSTTLFYRLRIVEADGQISFSTIERAHIPNTPIQVSVFPNPVEHDLLHLRVIGSKDPVYLQMYDNAGRQVIFNDLLIESNISLSTEHIPSGMYLLKVGNANFVQYLRVIIP